MGTSCGAPFTYPPPGGGTEIGTAGGRAAEAGAVAAAPGGAGGPRGAGAVGSSGGGAEGGMAGGGGRRHGGRRSVGAGGAAAVGWPKRECRRKGGAGAGPLLGCGGEGGGAFSCTSSCTRLSVWLGRCSVGQGAVYVRMHAGGGRWGWRRRTGGVIARCSALSGMDQRRREVSDDPVRRASARVARFRAHRRGGRQVEVAWRAVRRLGGGRGSRAVCCRGWRGRPGPW